MRFLADECCDFSAVRSLRAEGHDVLAVSEFQHRSEDKEVMELALTESRILLTEDKDFGWLVFAARVDSPGVILIRFPASARVLLAPGRFEACARTRFTASGGLRSPTAGNSSNWLRTTAARALNKSILPVARSPYCFPIVACATLPSSVARCRSSRAPVTSPVAFLATDRLT
jgi:hypothetical protein